MPERKDDPDQSPEAALAEDLGDLEARRLDQLAHMGGEVDDIDDYDPTGLDDGSDLDYVAPEDKDEDKDDEESADEDDDDKSTVEGEESDSDDAEEEEEADDADADVDSEDEDKAAAKPKGIPKHRFDEVNERRKTAEEENTRLKAELAAGKKPESEEEAFDFDAAEKEYLEFTLDGDTDSALAKRKEIRAAEHAEWKAEAKAETKDELSTDAEQTELLDLSKEAEGMFEVFDPDNDKYDQSLLDKVLVFMRGYEATGELDSRGDCFVAALADVVEMYDLMPEDDDAAADGGKPKPTGKKKVDNKKGKIKEQAHQPVGDQGSASADTGAAVPNIADMSDEDFDALPEKTQARLRGDLI